MSPALDRRPVLFSLFALASVGLTYALLSSPSSSSSSSNDGDDEPALTPEQCAKMFNELTANLNQHLNKLGSTLQQIQQSQPNIPQSSLQAWLLSEYEKGVSTFTSQLCSASAVSPDDFEDSTMLHLSSSNDEVTAAVSTFRDLYRKVGGVPMPLSPPPNLSKEEFVVALREYFGSLNSTMEECVSSHKKRTGRDTLSPADGPVVRQSFTAVADVNATKVLKGHGLDQEGLNAMLEGYKGDKDVEGVMRALAE
eukprot:CAMPEP_0182464858 /NCGR_PEP_ID=MMETSP1319-20130603/8870_1 /TAXON_ID=172717 /ORGANISM="Bolidomonas pacifica, Strain RCC208" /LENGTH=252 /DNA_ID=CAMNT_0024664527 /DNA_START=167 /DNA_END=922 /DNA_ORIENTATION=-